ncbi:MAG: hypothetical protein H6705_08750 [Myxococcales bacterium]|nr:hypothetical protein [Myxococcales bacterium]
MAFVVRVDGDAVVIGYDDRNPTPVERLDPGSAEGVARLRYWITLGATVEPAAAALLRARAPAVFEPGDLGGEAPELAAYGHDHATEAEQAEPQVKSRAGTPPAGLVKLLRYHQVDYDTFAPHEAAFYTGLAELLAWHDVIGAGEALDDKSFGPAVEAFQAKKGLARDGLPGRDTLWAMQRDRAADMKLATRKVPADAWGDAYTHFTLRADVADRYEALYADIKRRGGQVTSAGSFRALSAEVTAGRSETSIHYAGVALDLAPYSGLAQIRPEDPYVVERDLNGRGWRVWCRSASARPVTLKPKTWKGKLADADETSCAAFDLSAVCRQHGFIDIGPRKGYETTYGCLEWWHFQCEAVLVPFVSQFGIELLSLARYDEATLAKTGAWVNARNVFKSHNRGWH